MEIVDQLQELINKEIELRTARLLDRSPAGLYLPVNYSLEEGGKRLRPLLLLMAYNMFSDDSETVLPAAVAIEVFHNFTLLHDDIMDKAEVRRNKPTVYKQYNESTAILSGDAMAFLAYQFLMECKRERIFDVIDLFTHTALEVCEGQQYDMDFEAQKQVSEIEYLEMIRLKTAVLLGCSLKTGALLANANQTLIDKLYELGINLGLAFQVQDDWLDVFGEQLKFGKKIGGDILAGKKTWLFIKAVELADDSVQKELYGWLENNMCSVEEKIKGVISIYNDLGINSLALEKMHHYFSKAKDILDQLPIDRSRTMPLYQLIDNMIHRNQ